VRNEETAKATENEITLIVSAKALYLRAFWVQKCMGPTVFACLPDKTSIRKITKFGDVQSYGSDV
jgi:hypothetical protein